MFCASSCACVVLPTPGVPVMMMFGLVRFIVVAVVWIAGLFAFFLSLKVREEAKGNSGFGGGVKLSAAGNFWCSRTRFAPQNFGTRGT